MEGNLPWNFCINGWINLTMTVISFPITEPTHRLLITPIDHAVKKKKEVLTSNCHPLLIFTPLWASRPSRTQPCKGISGLCEAKLCTLPARKRCHKQNTALNYFFFLQFSIRSKPIMLCKNESVFSHFHTPNGSSWSFLAVQEIPVQSNNRKKKKKKNAKQ